MTLRRFFLFGLLFLAVTLLGLMPHRLVLWLGRGLGKLGFRLLRSRAQVAVENLELIYGPALSARKRVRLARDNFAHLGAAACEILHYAFAPARFRRRHMSCVGQEHLDRAMSRGRGVILFSAHMGNFILMGSLLSYLADLKWLFRDPSDRDLADLYEWIRRRNYTRAIPDNPRPKSAYLCGQHLKAGGALGILIDQVENGGVWVNFMGQRAGSTIGAARLAQITGALLVPAHCYRVPNGDLRVEIGPEFPIPRQDKDTARLPTLVEAMNRVVEGWVRDHPEQWLWGHRRWRSWRK